MYYILVKDNWLKYVNVEGGVSHFGNEFDFYHELKFKF